MNSRNLYLLAAIAGVALTSAPFAHAAEPSTPGSSDPASASSPAQRDSTSTDAPETATGDSPEATAASSPHQQDAVSAGNGAEPAAAYAGMPVQTPAGESIGNIKNVLLDSNGRETYAVISYVGTTSASVKYTAVPWTAVGTMVKGDKVLIDRAQLEKAPQVPGVSPDPASGTWSRDVDNYWRGKVTG